MTRSQTNVTLFPYTTLFRSERDERGREIAEPRRIEEKGRRREHVRDHEGDREPGIESRARRPRHRVHRYREQDRKSTRLNSSHRTNSYAVFCLKKKRKHNMN